MNSFKTKLIASMLAYGCTIGAALGAILYYVFPTFYPNWYLGILAFFLVVEPLIILFVEKSSHTSTPKQLLNAYMLTKVIKTVASLMFIAIYAIAVKEEIKSFVLTFMILYMLFLAVETILFTRIEKRLKEKQQ